MTHPTQTSLHGLQLTDNKFWACQRSEGPWPREFTIFDKYCPKCLLAMQAILHIQGDQPWIWKDRETGELEVITLSVALDRSSEAVAELEEDLQFQDEN